MADRGISAAVKVIWHTKARPIRENISPSAEKTWSSAVTRQSLAGHVHGARTDMRAESTGISVDRLWITRQMPVDNLWITLTPPCG